MKKNVLFAAVLLITLNACTSDESAPDQNEIGFTAITKNASKAIMNVGALPTTESFNVWGFYNADNDFSSTFTSNFMDGEKIEYTTGHNTATTPAWRNALKYYYWPATGQIGFYALYPSTVPVTGTVDYVNGFAINDYEVTEATKDQDLMYAFVAPQGKRTDAVNLTFNHALSQVEFALKTSASYDATFYIESIKINNIDVKANFSFNKAPTTTWSNNTDAQTSSINYYTTESFALSTTAATYGSSIVMIPQTMSTTAEKTTQLEIAYKLVQADGTIMPGTVYKNLTDEWVLGKKYVFTLSFILNEITFDPNVNDWVTATGIAYDLN